MKKYIKNKIKNLFQTYKTTDIYILCSIFHITIIEINLSVKGIFYFNEKNNFIFIKSSLNNKEKELVLIHEFAHFILHKKKIFR